MNTLFILVGVYIVIESFCAAYQMDGGDRLCRLLKYGFTLLAGFSCIYIGANGLVNWPYAIMMVTIFLFLWPRMLARLGIYQRRINDVAAIK